MAPLRFIYFDLGNVLLLFDHATACRQMAEVAGTTAERVREILFEGEVLQLQYERGDVSTDEFYDSFCKLTDTSPKPDELLHASSAMFELNVRIVPLVTHLKQAGFRLGILSNTCEAHWRYASDGRYKLLLDYFDVYALSFQMRAMKPEPSIYSAATELAEVSPEDIFFIDDRAENVAAACDAGFDAMLFSSVKTLVNALRERNLRFNY